MEWLRVAQIDRSIRHENKTEIDRSKLIQPKPEASDTSTMARSVIKPVSPHGVVSFRMRERKEETHETIYEKPAKGWVW